MDWIKEIERLEKSENEETKSAAVILRSLLQENQRIKKFNADISNLNRELSEQITQMQNAKR